MKDLIFKEHVEKFLLSEDSNRHLQRVSIDLDTHLWNEGLVDSFRIMELVFFLEDLLGREIAFEHNIIGSFQTIQSMYDSLVLKPAS
jgi:acyl carrier protein